MPSSEIPHHFEQPTKLELLIELSILDALIQPYLETALAIDESKHLDRLLEERDSLLDEIEDFSSVCS